MIPSAKNRTGDPLSLPGNDFDLDVGVIYTREQELIGPLLSTLKASADGLNVRLILVDNDSSERVGPWSEILPSTMILRNRQPLPRAVNFNRILSTSTARYVLLLNIDTFFDPRQQCLTRMVQFMDRHPACGISGCRLYHADGGDALPARWFQTFAAILARRCGLGRLLPHAWNDHFDRAHDPSETFECDWLAGCFLLVRREALAEVGFLDEAFGKHFEDADLCLRMARAGWHVMYHGGTSCYHLEPRDSRPWFSADAWRNLRAYFYWLKKWGWHPAQFSGRPFSCPQPA